MFASVSVYLTGGRGSILVSSARIEEYEEFAKNPPGLHMGASVFSSVFILPIDKGKADGGLFSALFMCQGTDSQIHALSSPLLSPKPCVMFPQFFSF